jgi:Zn-dependent protease with chaperone function
MTLVKARVTLFVVFLAGFFLQYGVIVYAFLKKRIYSDELSDLTFILIQVYSVPLAIVIGGIFSGLTRSGSSAKSTPRYYFVIAFLLVLAWNLLLIWRSTAFGLLAAGTVTDIADHLKQVSAYGSWLLAGCLAFYFSKK